MKQLICCILLVTICSSAALSQSQQTAFPAGWTGNWKGDLYWYKGKEPQVTKMELRIHPADSANKYSWQIIYGSESKDNRPYTLIAKDTAKGHWAIDEHNGIILDQFYIAGKLCGAFTVGKSTIINNYWIENDKLVVEFYALAAKPLATTGNGTEESPAVDSYKVNAWQKAILARQ